VAADSYWDAVVKHIGVLHESASSVVQATRGPRALDQSNPALPESFSDRTCRTPPAIAGAIVMLPVSTFQRGLEERLTGSAFSSRKADLRLSTRFPPTLHVRERIDSSRPREGRCPVSR
jgi:hypothetical protein